MQSFEERPPPDLDLHLAHQDFSGSVASASYGTRERLAFLRRLRIAAIAVVRGVAACRRCWIVLKARVACHE